MIQITAVILNWNGKKDTIECLRSLKGSKVSAHEGGAINFELQIIVVDNGSTDGSVHEVKKKFPNVEIIETGKNLGFAAGNNVGIKRAIEHGADFIFVLNNDTTVDKDIFINLLDTADKNKNAGIISPMIYFYPGFEFHKNRYSEKEKGRVIWCAGGIIDWDNVLASNYGVDDTDIGQYNQARELDFATGAAMFIRRELIEKIGSFDEKYFLYLEDADFSMKSIYAGWKIVFAPKAIVWHKVSQGSGIGSSLNDYFITRNRLLFGVKYAPTRAKAALLKESVKLLLGGREWQKMGVKDFYSARFGKGSWK